MSILKIIQQRNAEVKPVSVDPQAIIPENLLAEDDIKNLAKAFQHEFPLTKINSVQTEVYCSRLLPFADVLINNAYEIRFRAGLRDGLVLMEILNNLDFTNLNYNYNRQLEGNKVQPKSLLFIPENTSNIELLKADYIQITKNILENSLRSVANRGVRQ